MPPNTTYARPPGFYDRTPAEIADATGIIATLQGVMARFGYQTVETPLVEYADLFLTKSGDEAVNRLITFELYGRQLCLRSEFTPSAARLYVERYQHEPKPIRWQFVGPVFRYESAGQGRSRQFTMLGTELIGPSGVGGDGEAMGLAAHGLMTVGLSDWTLYVGHVGLIGALLDQFSLDRRMRRFVLGHIENLRRPERGRAYVDARLDDLLAGLPREVAASPEGDGAALEMLIKSANLGVTGTSRTSDDIARRLLNKQRRANQRGEIARALDFLEALAGIEGPPDAAFAALETLVAPAADESIRTTLRAFRAAIDLLPAYGVEPGRVRLRMGLARGLNYYTGLVFEVHSEQGQLCGGGRYDEFIRVLGAGADTPAVGFVYWIERILSQLGRRAALADTLRDVLVVPLDEADDAEAARVAMLLRGHPNAGAVELYTPPTRNLSQVLARASKRGTPYVVIIGGTERASGAATVRDMRAGRQYTCPVEQLAMRIHEGEAHP